MLLHYLITIYYLVLGYFASKSALDTDVFENKLKFAVLTLF